MTYRWKINVVEYDVYGQRAIKKTPTTILAETKTEVTTKVRAAFEAKYDDFRKFWSHGWELLSMDEVDPGTLPDDYGRPEKASAGILTDA